jgi:PAS domain S-box-containing protein
VPTKLFDDQGPWLSALLQALENARIGLAVTVDDGSGPRVAYVSQAAADIYGYTREEMLEVPPMERIAPEQLAAMQERRDRRMAGLPVSNPFESVIIQKGGQRVPIEAGTSWVPVGDKFAAVVFIRDISDRRRMQDRLAVADRMATVGTVAAGVAHEVNNPLTYVLLSLDKIARDLPKLAADPTRLAATRRTLDDALEGVLRVRNIVSDLRSFSHGLDEEQRPVDVGAVIQSAINIASHELRSRAEVRQHLQPVAPVVANEGRLGQVFLNLLVNAAQAIPEGQPERNEVRVSTRMVGADRVVVEVADTGCGMPPEVLRRAFDPFFTTKPIGIGTGLGLSICHRIITALGGELEAESRVGEGSVFRVCLPCEAVGAPRLI